MIWLLLTRFLSCDQQTMKSLEECSTCDNILIDAPFLFGKPSQCVKKKSCFCPDIHLCSSCSASSVCGATQQPGWDLWEGRDPQLFC